MNSYTKKEIEMLNKFISEYDRSYNEKYTLFKLFEDWNLFIDKISIGYKGTVYDYTNKLSLRDIIQDLIDSTSNRLKEKLEKDIKAIDEKFISVTKPSSGLYPSNKINEKTPFWEARIPIIILAELEETIGYNNPRPDDIE